MVELPEAIRSRLDGLHEQAMRAGESLAAMRAKVASLETECAELRDQQTGLRGRIDELEAENERIRHLKTENDEILARHIALTNELQRMLAHMRGDG